MSGYIHKVHYYETDKMGITHHSNYIRFMEEARMYFLTEMGWPIKRLESEGVTSPVVSLNCEYKRTTTYDDDIEINVSLIQYSGARLELFYVLTNSVTGEAVATATSSHCFLDKNGRPIAVKKHFPGFDAALRRKLNERSAE